jgi:beta-glucosidase
MILKKLGCTALAMLILGFSIAQELPYKNPRLDAETRAKDLLSRMTLEEKIGQMTQISTTEINKAVPNAKTKGEKFRPYLDPERAGKILKDYQVGSFLAAFAESPSDWYNFAYDLQKLNLTQSRLGIPIIYGNDHVHGANYVTGASVFPQPVGIGCTFNSTFASQMGYVTAREIADLGQHWNFAPILDIGRNPYWPRQYETFGEDTYLCTVMGKNYIEALQNEPSIAPYKIPATAKHFIGYSDPKTGYDRAPSIIPDQELREVFLPPFREAVNAGVKTFMINSGEVNGVPVHASYKILTGLLRNELGFKGVVVSDWADILQLIGQHHVAHNEKEATKMALLAGIDMSMTATSFGFCKVTRELVDEGSLPIEVIDRSVLRILKLKFELGLFENPYPRKDRFNRIGCKEHREMTLNAARESIVLLENNNNTLPLKENIGKILVTGPSANSKRNICGGWTIEWGGAPEEKFPSDMETVFTGLQKEFPKASVEWLPDSGKNHTTLEKTFKEKAAKADVIVVAVGEEPYAEGYGNTDDIMLPAEQQEVVKAAKASGKPVVLIVLAGRPRIIQPIREGCAAIIYAGLPAYDGGKALAEIISGKTNPSGKLSISYPANPGHLAPYNAKMHDKSNPAWPFGHGLSYAAYNYSNLIITDTIINRNKVLKASVTIKNTGKVKGKEAVLWYLKDEVRSITPFIKKLASFEKIELGPGESKTLSFEITPSKHLTFPDENGRMLLEDGYFELEAGGLKRRFLLKNTGAATQKGAFSPGNYLQEEL